VSCVAGTAVDVETVFSIGVLLQAENKITKTTRLFQPIIDSNLFTVFWVLLIGGIIASVFKPLLVIGAPSKKNYIKPAFCCSLQVFQLLNSK